MARNAQFDTLIYADPWCFHKRPADILSEGTGKKAIVLEKSYFEGELKRRLSPGMMKSVHQAYDLGILLLQDFVSEPLPSVIPEGWTLELREEQVRLIKHVAQMNLRYKDQHQRFIISDDQSVIDAAQRKGIKWIKIDEVEEFHRPPNPAETLTPQLGKAPVPIATTEIAENEAKEPVEAPVTKAPGTLSNLLWLGVGVVSTVAVLKGVEYRSALLQSWSTFGAALCGLGAVVLFVIRCQARWVYALLELFFGVYSVIRASAQLNPEDPQQAAIIQIVASVYIIVRGLDNYDNGWKPVIVDHIWQRVFRWKRPPQKIITTLRGYLGHAFRGIAGLLSK